MNLADIPDKFPIPWGSSAGGAFIRPIPEASQIGIENGAASLTDGFPPLNFDPISSGGVPPFGQDMNGILNQITLWDQWIAAGGALRYDAAYSTAIGGYPQGAILSSTTLGIIWINLVDGNTTNPDTGGANWTSVQSRANTWSGVNTYSGNIVLNNSVQFQAKDTGGTAHLVWQYAGDNNVYLCAGVGGNFLFRNSVNSATTGGFNDATDWTFVRDVAVGRTLAVTGGASAAALSSTTTVFAGSSIFATTSITAGSSISATTSLNGATANISGALSAGSISSGSTIASTTAITSGSSISSTTSILAGTHLRSTLGAFGSGDANAAVILSDFTFSNAAGIGTSITRTPDGIYDQVTLGAAAGGGGLVSTVVPLNYAFPTGIIDAVVCFFGNTPPAVAGSIAVQIIDRFSVLVTTNFVPVGLLGVTVRARGF